MNAAGLHILRAGPGCTLQDAGRTGWLRFGVTPAGPMDWRAHRAANRLAGAAPEAAALEIGPGGIEVMAEGAALRIGLVAPGFVPSRDGSPLPTAVALTLAPGMRLSVLPGARGTWAYLALARGLDVAPVMGSRATHLRSGLGPLGMVTAGLRLPILPGPELLSLPEGGFDWPAPPALPLRFVPGPQSGALTPDAEALFCTAPWVVAPRSDRMGYRLAGPRLTHAAGHDIVSDGIALGAIQVPGDGQPIVLMADRQPTGGYPKIGTVIRADLPALAQTRPGETVRFRAITVDEAVTTLRRALKDDDDLVASARPLRGSVDLDALASGNHASGFVRGDEG